jgi:hypothetical protein
MKMSYVQPAPAGSRFAPDAFEGQIGEEIPVNMPGSEPTTIGLVAATPQTARPLAAKVADDGSSVELQVEMDVELPAYGGGSFGFR